MLFCQLVSVESDFIVSIRAVSSFHFHYLAGFVPRGEHGESSDNELKVIHMRSIHRGECPTGVMQAGTIHGKSFTPINQVVRLSLFSLFRITPCV